MSWDILLPEFDLPQPARILTYPTRDAALDMLLGAGFWMSGRVAWNAWRFVSDNIAVVLIGDYPVVMASSRDELAIA